MSVVVATVEAGRTLARAVEALRVAAEGISTEIIVVDASSDGTVDLAESMDLDRVIRQPPGTLVPTLWADGIRRSRGKYVALTTGHFIVPPEWIRALTHSLERGAAGAGAGLVPDRAANGLDCGIVYLRYAEFLDLTEGEPRSVQELPGDNVAYPGEAVRSWVESHGGGFWELDYHDAVRRGGGRLVGCPTATASVGRSFPLRVILRHRFEHGRDFASKRVASDGISRWRIVAQAPFVPGLLALRAARRVYTRRRHALPFLKGIPFLLLLAAAWASGEAMGATTAPRHSG